MKYKVIKILAAVGLAFFTIGLFIAYAAYKKVDNAIRLIDQTDKVEIKTMTNDNLSEITKSNLNEQWMVAIFGIDSRDDKDLSGSNSDVIILASINNKTGDITLVSVYRDTCLKTGENRYKKVNEAYAVGGPKKAVEVLNENLDLEIDDYIAVNWKAVATAINILGGIDVEITNAELKYINGYITETVKSTGIGSVHLSAAGMQHLDGVQAVAYTRIRYTSGNDFRRTERQREVLTALLQKAKSSDWATLNNVIETVLPMTSSSIGTNDVIEVALNILKYNLVKNTGFPFEHKEKKADKQDFVFPDKLEDNVSKLHNYLYGIEKYEVSNTVKEISLKIEAKYQGSSNNSNVDEKRVVETQSEEETEVEVKEEDIEEYEDETAIHEFLDEPNKSSENYGPAFVITETEVELEVESAVEDTPGVE